MGVAMSWSMQAWLRLPSRIALLLGFSALSAAAAQASAPEIGRGAQPDRVPQQSAKSFGDLAIWSEAGRIYVSESGKPAQELRLGDTPEARQLRHMLERDGAVTGSPRVLLDRLILVGGGGDGFHWVPSDKKKASGAMSAPAATGVAPRTRTAPGQTPPPETPGLPSRTNTARLPEKG
jgi:hypothetical protein